MIGKTSAAASADININLPPAVIDNKLVTLSTGTGNRSFTIPLTGLSTLKSYLVIIKGRDGSTAIGNITPSSTDAKFSGARNISRYGNQGPLNPGLDINNIWNFVFKPLKTDISIRIDLNRVGGTDSNFYYVVQELF